MTERDMVANYFEHITQCIRDGLINGPVKLEWEPGQPLKAEWRAKDPIQFQSTVVFIHPEEE